jgi:putative peptidoglycan lipid II flippase
MVKRIFELLNREIRGLHEAAYLLAFFSFLSQILALLRDRLFAHIFGASHTLDTYYAAFKIPDLIFACIASIVSISVLVPFLVERFGKSYEEEKRFINSIFSIFALIMILVSVIVFIFTPELIKYIYPTFGSYTELITLTRILLLQPIILGVSNFLGSVTQAHQRFVSYAISPVVYNFGIVVGLVAFYPLFGLKGIAFGVLLGSLFHLGLQVPFIFERKLIPRFTIDIDWVSIKKVLLLSLPRTLTLAFSSISLVALTSLASRMTSGSIAVFNLSWNIQSVPLAIIGVSYSLAAFPTLSRYFANGHIEDFIANIVTSLRHIIFWSLPVTILFIILRAQIVRTILGSGNFNWNDTRLTAACLAIFVVSVVAQSIMLLFVRGYYAAGKTRKPLIINLIGALLIVAISYLSLYFFSVSPMFTDFMESLLRIEGLTGTSVISLALGYSLASVINAGLLWIIFEKDFPGLSCVVKKVSFQSFGASIIMGFTTYHMLGVLDDYLDLNTLPGIFFQGFIAGIVGIITWVIILRLLKSKELEDVWATLHKKIFATKIYVEDREHIV